MLVLPAKNTLEWPDVYPFLYLSAAFEGLNVSRITKHLVIDEMQDYTPIQYAVINLLFPCSKTILGDFMQSIHPYHLHSLEDIRTIYKTGKFTELKKSYRSTYEIITFAKHILDTGSLEPVKRRGEPPAFCACADEADHLDRLKTAVRDFIEGHSTSLGIITKTNAEASAVYDLLTKEFEVHLLTSESTSFQNGITVTSVRMSKGLEFDEVLIPDADEKTYKTEHDRNLLYIACTRAMHRLTLLYMKEISCFAGRALERDI